MLRVPSTLWGSKSFPALGKALAAAKPGRSVEIVLDFPRHPYGYPYPQHVCSSGPMPIRINRGRVHLVSGDTYITLLPDKQFLCKSTEDGRELALHFHPKFDYDLEIDAGSLKAGGGGHSLDEHGEMPGISAASGFQSRSMVIGFGFAFEWNAVRILMESWATIPCGNPYNAVLRANAVKVELPISTVARWITRILGTAILLLIAAFAIGEGVPNPLAQPLRVNLLFAAMLLMIAGQILAWKWERLGGLLILGGLAFFAIVNHGIKLNLVFGPMLAVGLLYLGCGCRTAKKSNRSGAKAESEPLG